MLVSMMKTIKDVLTIAPLPKVETEILLCETLQKDRSHLLAHPEQYLSQNQQAKIQKFISRRQQNEPLAYIIGHREFFGHDFLVTPDTLIPRPETEDLIEEVAKYLNLQKVKAPKILEIGTGSGAIAIILAKKFPNAEIIATDISTNALKIAKENAKRLKVKNTTFLQGDLLEPVLKFEKEQVTGDMAVKTKTTSKAPSKSPFSVIAANLPYITEHIYEKLEPQIKDFEPKVALVGGPTGMELYEKLFNQADEYFPETPVFYEVDGRIYRKN